MYCDTILNILSNFKQNQKEILIFLKNLYILLVENEMNVNQISNELIERFDLSLQGISKRNYKTFIKRLNYILFRNKTFWHII